MVMQASRMHGESFKVKLHICCIVITIATVNPASVDGESFNIVYIIIMIITIVTVNGNCPGTVDGQSFKIILYCHYHSNSKSSRKRW